MNEVIDDSIQSQTEILDEAYHAPVNDMFKLDEDYVDESGLLHKAGALVNGATVDMSFAEEGKAKLTKLSNVGEGQIANAQMMMQVGKKIGRTDK